MIGPVIDEEAEDAAGATGSRLLIVNRIKQALVTSRVTLGAQSTGLDPYDSSRAHPASVWPDRVR